MTTILAIDQLMIDRFFAKTRTVGRCIEWQGEIDRDGYGKYAVCRNGVKKRWMAHRFAYTITHGEIPDGQQVDHVCRNRRCVNPDSQHLEVVTQKENHDRWSSIITHCPRGHEYTPVNTKFNNPAKKTGRLCRECLRSKARERYWRDPGRARDRARRSRVAR